MKSAHYHRAHARALPKISWRRLTLGGGFFVILTALTLWWAVRQNPTPWQIPETAELQWPFLLAMIFLIPIEPLAGVGRIWLISRVEGTRVRFLTCVRSEFANIGMAMLTPFLSGGGGGQIYILYRSGVRLSVAFSISIIAFYASLVTLLLMATYATLTSQSECGAFLFQGLFGVLLLVAVISAICIFWPHFLVYGFGALSRVYYRLRRNIPEHEIGPVTDRAIAGILEYRQQMIHFVRYGRGAATGIVALTALFLLARAALAYCTVRFLGITESSFPAIVDAQVKLIAAGSALPTHGGAGVEVLSACFMPDLVPPGLTLIYLLLWRTSTLYLSGIMGLATLAYTFSRR